MMNLRKIWGLIDRKLDNVRDLLYRPENKKKKNKVQFPEGKVNQYQTWFFYEYPQLNEGFQKFIRSSQKSLKEEMRPQTLDDVYSNVLFILGPEKSGKSLFISHNLKDFEKADKFPNSVTSPLIMQLDFGVFPILSYEVFRFHLESLLINQLNKKLLQCRAVFGDQEILFLLLRLYHENYLKIFLKDLLKGIMDSEEYDQEKLYYQCEDKEQFFIKAQQIFENLMQNEDFDFKQGFLEFCEILGCQNQGFQIGLRLLDRIEFENRANSYETILEEKLDFLMEVGNCLCGFRNFHTKICDVVLVFNNSDILLNSYKQDKRIHDFWDHLILRLYSEEKRRNHFPVVIESNRSNYYSKEIFDFLSVDIYSFPCLEILGMNENDIKQTFSSIFHKREIDSVQQFCGNSLYDWTQINKVYLLKENQFVPVEKLEYFEKQKNILHYKINQTALNPKLNFFLDQGGNQFKFQIMNALQAFNQKDGWAKNDLIYQQEFIVENPIIDAMIEQNIFYNQFYYNKIYFQRQIFFQASQKIFQEKYQKFTKIEKIQYFLWKISHGIDNSDFHYVPIMFTEPENRKEAIFYEFASCYYPRSRPQHLLASRNVFF